MLEDSILHKLIISIGILIIFLVMCALPAALTAAIFYFCIPILTFKISFIINFVGWLIFAAIRIWR